MDAEDLKLAKRMNRVAAGEHSAAGETFAERAEAYYRERPHLLSLLHDLYNAYLCLSDRYSRALAKQRRESSDGGDLVSDDEDCGSLAASESESESTLSYQQPPAAGCGEGGAVGGDEVVAELVMKYVECDILAGEVTALERRSGESRRKIDLQRSLLEVMEAERVVLASENARLGRRVAEAAEENGRLAAEAAFVKKNAGELARCVLQMKDSRRVSALGRKVEDLQDQIRELEGWNRVYYDMLSKRDRRRIKGEKTKTKNKKKSGGVAADGGAIGRLAAKWCDRVRKNLDIFQCVPSPYATP